MLGQLRSRPLSAGSQILNRAQLSQKREGSSSIPKEVREYSLPRCRPRCSAPHGLPAVSGKTPGKIRECAVTPCSHRSISSQGTEIHGKHPPQTQRWAEPREKRGRCPLKDWDRGENPWKSGKAPWLLTFNSLHSRESVNAGNISSYFSSASWKREEIPSRAIPGFFPRICLPILKVEEVSTT